MSQTETITLPTPAPDVSLEQPNAAQSLTDTAPRSLLKSYMELGKVRLNAMVVITTAVGFIVASRQIDHLDWLRLFWTCLGTFLAAVGASGFNQVIEARRDARMNRTAKRPIPTRRISRTTAITFALLACIAGIAILCPTSNGLTACLCLANIVLYVAIYTPLKPLTSANTLVGAVVGGIPPVMGWAAAVGELSTAAWLLGAILFTWQIPHFLALAWLYRDDYARGGYKMLPVIEPSGRLTCLLALLYSLALIPLSITLLLVGVAGPIFAGGAILLGLGLFAFAFRLSRNKTRGNARALFLASVAYLPLLMALLVFDARGPFDSLDRSANGFVSPSHTPYIEPAIDK